MSTIKSSAEHLTLNADGASKDIKFQANGVEKASISSAGAFTSTTIDATALTGTIPNFTSTGIDDNATSTAVTLDSSGNVGIGSTSIGATLGVGLNSSTAYSSTGEPREDIIIHNTNGSDGSGVNNYSSLSFHVADGATSQGFINYVRTADNQGAFTFSQRTGSSSYAEAMRIQSGGGISFNGDTAAANALDDYEEGTWTPTFAGGTVTNSYGNYVKVGNVVHVEFGFHNGTITGTLTGDPSVSGLPFTSKANRTSGSVSYLGIFSGSSNVTFLKYTSTTTGNFLQLNAGADWTGNGIGTGSSKYLHVSITYATT